MSGIIHVLYESMKSFVDEATIPEEGPIMEISQEEVQMAIALTEYFQAQRQAYDKVN